MAKKKTARRAGKPAARKRTATRGRRTASRPPRTANPLLGTVVGAEGREVGRVRLDVGRAGEAQGESHIEYADGCVVEHRAPQVLAIEPGHDGWVVGNEPVVVIEFDFEGDTVRRLGMPAAHRHA